MLVLSGAEVRQLLQVERMLEVLEAGFREHSAGETSIPPRTAARSGSGLLGAMPGWVKGAGLGIKAVTVFPGNVERSLASHQAVILLVDPDDGRPLCLMDGEHITAMRTGGASAVSVKLLARRDARTLAILGAGVQGHSHLATVPLVRPFDSIRVASRDRTHAEELAALDPRCTVAESFEDAVQGADVVCCCTDAREPILETAWLGRGTHVTSVGGTFGPEIPADLITSGKVFVEWRGAVEHAPPAGARELQGVDPPSVAELGEVLAGTRPGRTDDGELTLYKSTGVAFEDIVVARMVFDEALRAGVGISIEL